MLIESPPLPKQQHKVTCLPQNRWKWLHQQTDTLKWSALSDEQNSQWKCCKRNVSVECLRRAMHEAGAEQRQRFMWPRCIGCVWISSDAPIVHCKHISLLHTLLVQQSRRLHLSSPRSVLLRFLSSLLSSPFCIAFTPCSDLLQRHTSI